MGRGFKCEIGYKGLAHLINQLERLSTDTEEMCKRAIYDGAAIVGNEMRHQIKTIPVLPEQHGNEKIIYGASKKQIDGLVSSLGLAPMKYIGRGLNTKIGFDGYNDVKTKKYPKGQPNAMIARAINVGNSFRKKYPFIQKTVKYTKDYAQDAMANSLQNSIDSIVND